MPRGVKKPLEVQDNGGASRKHEKPRQRMVRTRVDTLQAKESQSAVRNAQKRGAKKGSKLAEAETT